MRIIGKAQLEYELFKLEDSHLGDMVERFFDGKWAVMAREPAKCPVCNSRPWRWATLKESQELDVIYQRWKNSVALESKLAENKSTKKTTWDWDDALEQAMTPIEANE